MSGLPYLQKLRKSDLAEFADTTKLADYASLKKAELEVALDEHLRTNSTTYSKVPSLSEYYKRLGSTSRSPIKRMAEKVSETLKSDEEDTAPVKKSRRKTTTRAEDTTDTESPVTTLIKQAPKEIARRSSILTSQIPIPPSPAVVTDAIDRETRRIRTSISHAYDETHIHEYSDAARDYLSSPLTVTILATLLEAYALRATVLPNKLLTEVPAIPYIKSTRTAISVPDLFLLLDSKFWAPFSLWALTSLILPALISYFINLPLKAHPSHNYSTRRAATQHNAQMQFDPFIFNLAKGVIAYIVYAHHFNLGGIYQHFTIATVNESILGGFFAVIVSSGIGAAVSLYEAVLKK
ncbi:hypothetical protein LTR10_012601 [Elasticomyces elasticus]|uniref:Uncharacterized protein n=1 Tax=Exophiala sideris TaxID=1016849 RepID=A0ABR0JRJ0_9EURO|nr:hypothetical protein LTR10_012601 [Elasticomyces elasticus]KAK5040198.1 hypothetical protein LTS07_000695 [Exophiala sideris]KAK5043376.1 hypothetical protein LTR13_001147 [Exophiala sideris]KAK5068576.1 hypothetical protein LTR69_000696 [Exophiala sideris]KAK5186174.1 hypothetical protein LTR44_001229 [Eurotiomycetes sp. CCFEE 6388]